MSDILMAEEMGGIRKHRMYLKYGEMKYIMDIIEQRIMYLEGKCFELEMLKENKSKKIQKFIDDYIINLDDEIYILEDRLILLEKFKKN